MDVVEIADDGRFPPLRDRLECGVALKKVERGDDVFVEEVLVVLAEERDRVRLYRADARRRRQRARLGKRVADAGEVEEPVLPEKRKVAFDQILVVRIERRAVLADGPPFRFLGELVRRRHDPPPVGHLLVSVVRNFRRAVASDDRRDHRLPLDVALNLHAQKLRRGRTARGGGDGPGAGFHGRGPDQCPMIRSRPWWSVRFPISRSRSSTSAPGSAVPADHKRHHSAYNGRSSLMVILAVCANADAAIIATMNDASTARTARLGTRASRPPSSTILPSTAGETPAFPGPTSTAFPRTP